MGDPKNPWDDVPIEVLIEYERKKREEAERARPRIYVPQPRTPQPRNPDPDNPDSSDIEDSRIVIKLI